LSIGVVWWWGWAIAIGGGFGGFWGDRDFIGFFIVPMLCVGMLFWTLCVLFVVGRDAERLGMCYHAERGNDAIFS
jgi:hypothetical protein